MVVTIVVVVEVDLYRVDDDGYDFDENGTLQQQQHNVTVMVFGRYY